MHTLRRAYGQWIAGTPLISDVTPFFTNECAGKLMFFYHACMAQLYVQPPGRYSAGGDHIEMLTRLSGPTEVRSENAKRAAL